MPMPLDLVGTRFGRLVPVRKMPKARAGQATPWECVCDCGKTKVISGTQLTSGKTQSCGCIRKEQLAARNMKHGHAARGKKPPEYHVWHSMRRRCTEPSNKRFADWGGRGIRVCDRWLNDFATFLSDMGRRPSSAHSIDRINNDGHYEPDNCRWATAKEQAANKRPSVSWHKRSIAA